MQNEDAILQQLAKVLPAVASDKRSNPEYELMSDAFIWADEKPTLSVLTQDQLGVLRSLWRYRTSLMTGIEDRRFEKIWSTLKKLTPEWVGFQPDRCAYSSDLAARYLAEKRNQQKLGFSI